ncbi:copper resistance CopC/CopD family protein [Streptomyces marinisediminis]|uniref:copper resistance CopC/CopD family protein n=1 Tax=Streptomyces TaxID=1883 RepID=UPI003A4C5D62
MSAAAVPPAPARPAAGGAGRAAARTLLALLLAVAALGAGLAAAPPAAAHATLTSTAPAEGAVVDRAPEEVTLTFSEEVGLSGADAVRVLDPNGDRVDDGGPTESAPRTFSVRLTPGIPDGTYTVAWQAVSADSHPIAGAFTFSVGAPSRTSVDLAAEAPAVGGGPVGFAYDAARYAGYAGFLLLVGGAAFVLACWREGAGVRVVRRVVVVGWVTVTAATLALLALRHPYVVGGSFADALDLAGLSAVLASKTGTALVSRLLLLATAALFVTVLFGTFTRPRPEPDRRDLLAGLALGGGVVAAGLAATWALSEHASTGLQTGVAVPVDVVHLLAMAAWLGGLAALAAVLRWGPPVPRPALARFSRLALVSVLVLVVTGLYQSWRQVGSLAALTSTGYGRLLIAKVLLVAALVGVAALSRRWVARVADAGADAGAEPVGAVAGGGAAGGGVAGAEPEPGPAPAEPEPAGAVGGGVGPERAAQLARQRAAVATARRRRAREADVPRSALRRSVLAEAGVAVVLLAVTTALTGTEPARTQAAETSERAPAGPVALSVPFDTGGPDGRGTADVELAPGRPGENEVHVYTDVAAEEVRVALTLPARDLGPISVTPAPADATGRHWSASGVNLPLPGEWELALTVRTSDVDQVTETRPVTLE